MIGLYTHEDMLDHRPGEDHPERPERLAAVIEALEAAEGLDLEPRDAPLAELADLLRVHDRAYVEHVLASAPRGGRFLLGGEAWMSPGTLLSARRAAGAVAAAVRAVAAGEISRAFCAVRPPGCGAQPGAAGGFSIFANLAVGARVAQASGLPRVAVIGFGGGVQPALAAASDIFSGAPEPDAGAWRAAFEAVIASADAFRPDIVLVAAGFDADLGADDYAWATARIMMLAQAHARGRVVSALEGGYDLEALARSAAAHVRALQGE